MMPFQMPSIMYIIPKYLTKHGTLNSINLKFERQAVKFFRGQASSFTHLLIEQRRRGGVAKLGTAAAAAKLCNRDRNHP